MNKVSVVIPAYKAEKSIVAAVCSALDQGEKVAEVIVVIDGLLDSTQKALEQIEDSRLVIIVFEENQGAQIARNAGLNKATEKYIIFLDSDDHFEGPLIEGMIASMQKGDFDICFSPNCLKSFNTPKRYFVLPPKIDSFELLIGRALSTMAVGIQCILWDKAFLKSVGGWDESIVRNQDGELVIRALTQGARHCINEMGAGCSVQHEGERVSQSRSLSSFTSQQAIYNNLKAYLKSSTLNKQQKERLAAAINAFCIKICIGMAEAGYTAAEYKDWRENIQWHNKHFLLLPKKKALQAALFFLFSKKTYRVQNALKKLQTRRNPT